MKHLEDITLKDGSEISIYEHHDGFSIDVKRPGIEEPETSAFYEYKK